MSIDFGDPMWPEKVGAAIRHQVAAQPAPVTISKAREALELAAMTFRYYEFLHREKNTLDGIHKAAANAALAAQMEAALATPEPEAAPAAQAEPVIDTCDLGHKFAKLATHPMRDGKARCPNCMSIGLDACRAAQAGPVQGEGLKQAIRDFMWANEHSTLNGMPMSETESWLRFEQALASFEGQQPGGAT